MGRLAAVTGITLMMQPGAVVPMSYIGIAEPHHFIRLV